MKHKYILASAVCLALLGAPAAWPQVNLNPLPSRILGRPMTPQMEQAIPYSINPNLVEGRELYQPLAIAIDNSASTPAIYVSDAGNNRVLGWKNAANFSNGQMADIVVGQVDFFTTWAQGPGVTPYAPGQGTSLQSGLYSPTGLAVDGNGNLYVADSGNNRVLRFPKPFTNADHIPDLVIGQAGFNSRTSNYTGQVAAQGIYLANSSTAYQSNLAFDGSGNLWMTDPGNRRVLEFLATDLAKGGGGLTAALEIGQADFTSLKTNLNSSATGANATADQFAQPSAIAFDPQGRLFVSDYDPGNPVQFSRVLVFAPPFTNAMAATRIMGVLPQTALTPPQIYAIAMDDPEGIFFLSNGQIGVVDTGYNRILVFPSYDQWPATAKQFSPSAAIVVGQNADLTARNPNNAPQAPTFWPPPSASVFFHPIAAVLFNSELFVADSVNNRVVVMPLQPSPTQPTFGAATRVLGQYRMDTGSINLVEGKELYLGGDAGTAIDSTGGTPHLYVADPSNNRILGYKDMRKAGPGSGSVADIVIGQANGQTALCNYPTGDPAQPTSSNLCHPVGMVVDSKGNLWVADRGNGRVLRFPAPFAQTGTPAADLVLGQASFTTKTTDPTQSTMSAPYGLAITVTGLLVASDQAHNRILVFQPQSGVFQNGQAAAKVIGQPDFHSSSAASDPTAFNAPHHIAVDTSALLYVADSGNNRVQIFGSVDNLPAQHASAVWTIGNLNAPEGVYVSPSTGEIWVADTNNHQALRYPMYFDLITGAGYSASIPTAGYPLAVQQDPFGALVLADSLNRVGFYFPKLAMQNAANYLDTGIWGLAPGTWGSIYPAAGQFISGQPASPGGQIPFPTTLADTQVLFNGTPAPLSYVGQTLIDFYVPMSAPAGVGADVQVVRKSTGQVLGATSLSIVTAAPAMFTSGNKNGNIWPVAAINHDDGTVNSSTNPAKRGSYVELYGTGQGFIAGAPGSPGSSLPDGTPTPLSPLLYTTQELSVYLGSGYLGDAGAAQGAGQVQFSGMAPGLVGVWQINIQIPPLIDITRPAPLVVVLASRVSAGVGMAGVGYNTVLYVK